MQVTVDDKGALIGVTHLSEDLLKAIKFATEQVGQVAVGQMQSLIKGHHKMGTPTPSPRGTPPTNVTGHLRTSIWATTQGFKDRYTVVVGPHMIYARSLEEGIGKNKVKYPFVAPTAKMMREKNRARNIYVNALRDVTSKPRS
jgi:hypothetical protein